MFRKEIPRVYELRDLIKNPESPDAFFQDFDRSVRDEPSKKEIFFARENDLRCLDETAWQFLKNEARPYLTKRDPTGRGWQQLWAILYQARAFNFLREIGCSNVYFIPRDSRSTPDLQAEANGVKVLCEVKTINISNEEACARRQQAEGAITCGSTTDQLAPEFLNKLMCSLGKARAQMESCDGRKNARRLAYVVVDFDDPQGEYKDRYYNQIDRHLAENPIPGLEIVFHNQKTAFHKSITMTSATVVNE